MLSALFSLQLHTCSSASGISAAPFSKLATESLPMLGALTDRRESRFFSGIFTFRMMRYFNLFGDGNSVTEQRQNESAYPIRYRHIVLFIRLGNSEGTASKSPRIATRCSAIRFWNGLLQWFSNDRITEQRMNVRGEEGEGQLLPGYGFWQKALSRTASITSRNFSLDVNVNP